MLAQPADKLRTKSDFVTLKQTSQPQTNKRETGTTQHGYSSRKERRLKHKKHTHGYKTKNALQLAGSMVSLYVSAALSIKPSTVSPAYIDRRFEKLVK